MSGASTRSLLVFILVMAGGIIRAQDSLRFRWGVELGVTNVVGLRGQLSIYDKHRILLGLAYAEPVAYNFYPVRFGYRFAPTIEGRKHKWIYAYEMLYGWKTHVSPSRLILNDNSYILTDLHTNQMGIDQYFGFGMEFNLLKYFKMNASVLLGYRIYRSNIEYSNPNLATQVYNYSEPIAALALGLVCEFSAK